MTVDDFAKSQENQAHLFEACVHWTNVRKRKLYPCKTELVLFWTAHWRNLFNEPSSFTLSGAETRVSEKKFVA